MVMSVIDLSTPSVQVVPLRKLRQDLRAGLTTLTAEETRFLVDAYYQSQDYRIQAANQVRASGAAGEPHEVIVWHFEQMQAHENEIRRVLDAWTESEPTGMGVWLKGITGIGPVLAAGLLAHIDITRAPTVGHIWRFAGLDPTDHWGKSEKRPWNARLKVIAWKCGESFVKVSGNQNDVYGHLYARRKLKEQEKNKQGLFADQAAAALAAKKFRPDTEARKWYEQGKLPPAHIHARAKRWAVKLFLAHFWEEWYRRHYGKEPPLPYPIAVLGHAHRI